MIVEGKSSVSRKRKTLGNLSRYDNAVDNITDEESTDMEEEEENDGEGTKKRFLAFKFHYVPLYLLKAFEMRNFYDNIKFFLLI